MVKLIVKLMVASRGRWEGELHERPGLVLGFGFGVLSYGCRVLSFGFWVLGFGFWVWKFVFGI